MHTSRERQYLFTRLPVLMSVILSLLLSPAGLATSTSRIPKNVIVVIGDGMGQEWIKAAHRAKGEPLSFEKFPAHTTMMVSSASAPSPTDSTAAATAMMTGRKVNNTVTSVALPGDGSDLKTLLEKFQAQGKSVGLITNSTFYDATPAAFAAHAPNRNQFCKILSDYFTRSRPNVILGASKDALRCIAESSGAKMKRCSDKLQNSKCRNIKQMATDAGYHVVGSLSELNALDNNETHVLGAFGLHKQVASIIPGVRVNSLPFAITDDAYFKKANIPRLADMVDKAIDILSRNPKGFFLLVENENTDSIGHAHQFFDLFNVCLFKHCFGLPHSNDIVLAEMAEIDKTVALIDEKTKSLNGGSRLIIVTADHDTGGLTAMGENGQISWDNSLCSGRVLNPRCLHTLQDVGIWATGQNAKLFDARNNGDQPIDNTEFSLRILGQAVSPTKKLVARKEN